MLNMAIIFIVLATTAVAFGFKSIPDAMVETVMLLFFVFLAVFVIAVLIAFVKDKRAPPAE